MKDKELRETHEGHFQTTILDSKIDWVESPDTKYLQARFNDKVARLRFNDWPDEILCTIFIDSDEQDWEDWPEYWTLTSFIDVLFQ